MSKNLITQLISLLLLAFTFSGLAVNPDETAATIVDYLSNGQFIALLTYVLINLVNVFVHWVQQLKEDPKQIWSFLKSVNFWVSAANIVTGFIFLTWGIQIDTESLQNMITLIFSEDYWGAGSVFVVNILIPFIKVMIGKKK